MIFRSADTGIRVTLDRIGNVISRTNQEDRNMQSDPSRTASRASATEDGRIPSTVDASPDSPDAHAMAESESVRRTRLDALLDAALQDTFPASDPVALCFEAPNRSAKAFGEAP